MYNPLLDPNWWRLIFWPRSSYQRELKISWFKVVYCRIRDHKRKDKIQYAIINYNNDAVCKRCGEDVSFLSGISLEK